MHVLTPLRTGADGSQQVTMVLQPEGLGTVRATVSVLNGTVTVHLNAETPEGQQALASNLATLQHELQGDGSRASVILQSGTDGQGSNRGPADQRAGAGSPGGAVTADDTTSGAAGTRPASTAQRLVDLRL